LSLINDVLDLSKVESGKMDVYYESIDGPAVLDEVMHTIQPLVDKHGNTLVLDQQIEPGEFVTDVMKFRQILLNLLSNASKFTQRGQITVTARRKMVDGTGMISVAVTDTGIGMTAEQLEKVFDEFAQADVSTSKDYGGTGLGLAICKRFAQLMGGDIEVESEMGSGSCFTLSIPADEPKKAASLPAEGQATGLASILVIDDDPSARDISTRILEKQGFSVTSAASGAEGLEAIVKNRPDVVVLDVMMPGMDGWQVLEQLKADPETADIPVVMQSMLSEREMGLSLGADDYITKPVDKAQLNASVRSMLPTVNHGNQVLVIEQGSAIRDQLTAAFDGAEGRIFDASDLAGAETVLNSNDIDLILIGLFEQAESVGALLNKLNGAGRAAATPIVRINSADLEDQRADHLVGYIREQLSRNDSAE
jgi:DNA-binding response OmpR family regulator/two-component sensor histidine kinase